MPSRSSSWVRSSACSSGSARRPSTAASDVTSPAGSVRGRRRSPRWSVAWPFPRRAEEADHGLGVADVDGKQHHRPPIRPRPGPYRQGRARCRGAGAEWVRAPTEIRSAPAAAYAGAGLQAHAPRHLHQHGPGSARWCTSATQRATSSGVMLSRSTAEAPAASASVDLVRPVALDLDETSGPTLLGEGHRLCRCRARPRWLSFTNTASERLPRWFQPLRRPALPPSPARAGRGWSSECRGRGWRDWPRGPPPRTGASSSPLRIGGKGNSSAVRSAVRSERIEPDTSARQSPSVRSLPSGTRQSTSRLGSTWAKVSIAQSLPADTPAARATRLARAEQLSGTSDPLRSPRGSTSSASALATVSLAATSGGSTQPGGDHPAPPATGVMSGPRAVDGTGQTAMEKSASPPGQGLRVLPAGVGTSRLGAHFRGSEQCLGQIGQVR